MGHTNRLIQEEQRADQCGAAGREVYRPREADGGAVWLHPGGASSVVRSLRRTGSVAPENPLQTFTVGAVKGS